MHNYILKNDDGDSDEDEDGGGGEGKGPSGGGMGGGAPAPAPAARARKGSINKEEAAAVSMQSVVRGRSARASMARGEPVAADENAGLPDEIKEVQQVPIMQAQNSPATAVTSPPPSPLTLTVGGGSRVHVAGALGVSRVALSHL